MRIVHVVTALSPDNRFGGPARVALDLAAGAKAAGHEVVVIAAGVGYDVLPTRVQGIRVALARGFNPTPFLGWASLVAPGLPRLLRGYLPTADVVHVHLARDVVTLTGALAARRAQVPYVVQTHGMIDAAGGRLAQLVDRLATRRAVRGAAEALVLTGDEEAELQSLGLSAQRISRFPNGVDAPPVPRSAAADGPVLFLARLHPRKGAAAFTRAAVRLAATRPEVRFAVVGPDEGDAAAVQHVLNAAAPAVRAWIERIGGVSAEEARLRLAEALVYVLPAEAEPFGMTVIEAMSAGRPVVLAQSAELAPVVREARAGWTFGPGGDHPELEAALAAVLDDRDEIEAAGARATALVRERFRIEAVVEQLLEHYERIARKR